MEIIHFKIKPMKIKFLLTISFLAAAFYSYGQLARIVLQPNGGGNPQVFVNFDDAINAAEANDRIYMSGGGFQSDEPIMLDFPVHLIGAGIHPDSTAVTNATTLTTSEAIVITNGGSNSSFTGIKFASDDNVNFRYGTSNDNDDPIGVYFERCEFQNDIIVTSVNFNEVSNSETVFNENIFRADIRGADNSAAYISKCIFVAGSSVGSIDGGGLIVDHCVFFGNSLVLNSQGSAIRNTIFVTSFLPLYQCNGSVVQNCFTTTNGYFGNSSGTITNSFTSQTSPFVDETDGVFDFTDNLAVDNLSAASGSAVDGTDMGLYGSGAPAKLGAVPYNPHYLNVEIAPSTDGNGNLPVTIKTQAQNY